MISQLTRRDLFGQALTAFATEIQGSLRGVLQVVHEHVARIGPVEPVPTLTANVPTANVEKIYITPSSRVELLLDSTRDQN